MPIDLETIPPDAIKLIKANFGFKIFGDRNEEMIETLWRTDDNRYLINYGLEFIEISMKDAIDWIDEVLTLDSYHYTCYNETDPQVLLADLYTNFQLD
jgi:hypothetical protein